MKRDDSSPAAYRASVEEPWQKDLLAEIRTLIFEVAPDVDEYIEYGMLAYGDLATLAAQKLHVALRKSACPRGIQKETALCRLREIVSKVPISRILRSRQCPRASRRGRRTERRTGFPGLATTWARDGQTVPDGIGHATSPFCLEQPSGFAALEVSPVGMAEQIRELPGMTPLLPASAESEETCDTDRPEPAGRFGSSSGRRRFDLSGAFDDA